MVGVGAAGTACMLMLRDMGVTNIIGCDRKGALYVGRDGMNDAKATFAEVTNPDRTAGSLTDVLAGADVFIGLQAKFADGRRRPDHVERSDRLCDVESRSGNQPGRSRPPRRGHGHRSQ